MKKRFIFSCFPNQRTRRTTLYIYGNWLFNFSISYRSFTFLFVRLLQVYFKTVSTSVRDGPEDEVDGEDKRDGHPSHDGVRLK